MKLFQAKIVWYNEDVDRPEDSKTRDYMLIAADHMVDATKRILQYYGEDNIGDLKISVLNTQEALLRIPEQCYNQIWVEGEY